jgi:septum formation protein
VLEKPKDRPDAIQMLSKLSGSTHSVITAVSLTSNKKQVSFSDETMVTFKNITQAQIEHYVDNYEPYDKAGSYGIQEWLGYIAIEKIEGCYFNVMGFPLRLVYEEIEKF